MIDQASTPATGASGLPAGLFAPHVSPDDSVLSRLSRSGVRTTLQQARDILQKGQDWQPCGVLEHRVDASSGMAPDWATPGHLSADWSQIAPAAALQAAALPTGSTACWHARAGWIRPAQLVRALLAQPGMAWRGGLAVARLVQSGSAAAPMWQALDAQGAVLAEAPQVVVATGYGSDRLLPAHWPLQRVRGQVSWGLESGLPGHALPPFPVNGKGSLVPHIPTPDGLAWYLGSTFERDIDSLPPSPADQAQAHAANVARLALLLPALAPGLLPLFAQPAPEGAAPLLHNWSSVRCVSADRLPVVGPVNAAQQPGLWVCTAMGARGLTLALLCGELLAAQMLGEPLPLDARLARALSPQRL